MKILDDLLNSFSGKRHQGGATRSVYANKPEENNTWKFANNAVKTSRYNIATFLLLNLIEQLKQASNIYFILLGIIQGLGEIFPEIESSSPITTIGPLLAIWCISFLKNAYDDIGRHNSDRRLNNQKTSVLNSNGKPCPCKWEDVKTGDLIRIETNEPVCADILILSSSDEGGLCFIETAELDGESNLKVRQPNIETMRHFGYEENEEMFFRLAQFQGKVECEAPNNRLERFEGNLELNGNVISLENSNVILRGCVLRNTAFVYGLVVYSGHETKLMMNSGKQSTKRTKLDWLTNELILWIAGCLSALVIFSYIASYVWETGSGISWQGILKVYAQSESSPAWLALLNAPPSLLLLSTLIPVSLLLSMEIIRLGHSLLINWDLKIYHEDTDTPALARNTGLAEELGQIQYIFSDKTGTLTQNEMIFKQCSINGRIYGHAGDDESFQNLSRVNFSFNRYADPNFDFRDQDLVDAVVSGDKDTVEFFRLLALCHSVMVEENSSGTSNSSDSCANPHLLQYQAQSPDEGALVSAACNFGAVFKSRAADNIIIECNGLEESYELLCVLDFDNVRKRMSVIVRKNNQITLYCKGADTIMYELLSDTNANVKEKTSKDLDQFAQSGLRTLLLASRQLTEDEFQQWFESFEKANTEMEDREEKVMATFCEIEKDLNLLGATAIEDKLQEGVPESIARLAEANINIWVLTGDKQETAINIGYSSLLLTEGMIDVFIVDGNTESEVLEQIEACLKKAETFTVEKDDGPFRRNLRVSFLGEKRKKSESGSTVELEQQTETNESGQNGEELMEKEGFGLVVPGKSLAFALQPEHELKFLELAKLCKAVICCRVTPLQKALVVELVKRNVNATTLAIGDGANDVSMIKAAHIGVGISGKEGRQAVLAADYSFAQFRFLERLLLVHGRWSYWRMSKFLNYFFYKNFAFTWAQFWFSCMCGFTSTVFFEPMFLTFYNLAYTSLPVFGMGIFDQDVSDKDCLNYQKLYVPGQQNILFNKKTFALKVLHGILSSCVIFFIPFGVFLQASSINGNPSNDFQMLGLAVSAILVLIVTLQIGLDTEYWTWINFIFIFISLLGYFIFTLIISGTASVLECFGSGSFWSSLILVFSMCIPPCMGYRWFMQKMKPTLVHSIRQRDAKTISKRMLRRDLLSSRRRPTVLRPELRRRPASTRSAFAFSQEKGLGTLLLKGKLRERLRDRIKGGSYNLETNSHDPNVNLETAPCDSNEVVHLKSTPLEKYT